MEHWYTIANEDEVDSPALLVYPERIKHNIAMAISMIGDVNRLRPHVKTHKTNEILQLQLDAGITKFKCATIAEAEMLGEGGAPDVLLAYPVYGPKLMRFLDLLTRFRQTKFSVVVDNEGAATALSEAALAAGETIDTYIDLNVGMGRTGIAPGAGALALYRLCAELEGISIKGFHAYDGHVREIDLEKRKTICDRNFEPIAAMVRVLESEGFDSLRLIIGGSPSFPIYAKYSEVECSPGTFALWDKGYGDTLPEQKFLPAAVLLCRVISLPEPGRICVDLGYKAVASENLLERRVYFLDAPNLTSISHSEEHLVLEAPAGHGFRTGDVLYALPIHICPTVALYDRLTVVQDGSAVGNWPVAARQRS
ncbi:D-TA family PLP-dependent enzyme [Parapedobacter sp. 10938]|uniref:D-TA family PLP-dependent enzyme n=1 Tax=Parapedobacter flavus TaxID=3110225 RepID=UPI002DB969FC|nr:D-TA family PLP-dependent enzyme [Parapedobacter sp. 10938]MEC3878580.1 D-TA family PLP-dependent enzyme [Parapedobacter sp. 10938]